MYAQDIHYLADGRKYEPIQTTVRRYPDGRFGVDRAPYRTALVARSGEGEYDVSVEMPSGSLQWRILSLGYYDGVTGHYATIEQARSVEMSHAANTAVYPEIFTGIDYRVVHLNSVVKEEIVLSQAVLQKLPSPTDFGISVADAYLMVEVQYQGGDGESAVLPFQSERVYFGNDVADAVLERVVFNEDEQDHWLAGGSYSELGQVAAGDVTLESSISMHERMLAKNQVRFDMQASGVPSRSKILSARLSPGNLGKLDRQFEMSPVVNSETGSQAKQTGAVVQKWNLKDHVERWLADPGSNLGLMVSAKDKPAAASAAQQAQITIEWVDNTSTVYYLKDHLGSVRATVNEVGEVVSYDDYDPWGLTLADRSMNIAQSDLPNKFTGKERDTDFGLDWDYFGARYYNAEIGRWMSVDPKAQLAPDVTPYQYTHNNPVVRIDPDGERDLIKNNIRTKNKNLARVILVSGSGQVRENTRGGERVTKDITIISRRTTRMTVDLPNGETTTNHSTAVTFKDNITGETVTQDAVLGGVELGTAGEGDQLFKTDDPNDRTNVLFEDDKQLLKIKGTGPTLTLGEKKQSTFEKVKGVFKSIFNKIMKRKEVVDDPQSTAVKG